jgi:hypothetical protein
MFREKPEREKRISEAASPGYAQPFLYHYRALRGLLFSEQIIRAWPISLTPLLPNGAHVVDSAAIGVAQIFAVKGPVFHLRRR